MRFKLYTKGKKKLVVDCIICLKNLKLDLSSSYLYHKVLQAWAEACGITCILYLQPTNNSTPALGNKANKQEVAKVVTSYNS